MRPTLLDLFCGAGGAAVGYHRAGFDVTGVDLSPQPHYPFTFIRGDALGYVQAHGHEYDAIHASPPCQEYSALRHAPGRRHIIRELLIEETRQVLDKLGVPWVLENVIGAPATGIALCGTMFGLRVFRHRLFESDGLLLQPHHTTHRDRIGGRKRPGDLGQYGPGETGFVTVAGHMFSRATGSAAMGIDWMTRDELAQAIPPAYTEFVGHQLRGSL